MTERSPGVWRVYVREGGRGRDYAEEARKGDFIAFGGRDSGEATDFASEEEFVRAYTAGYADGEVRATQIWKLLEKGNPGDWVLMPCRRSRRVHIGQLGEGGYFFERADPSVRFAHRWPVDWHGDVSYDEARDALGPAVLGQRALAPLDVSPKAVASLVRDPTARTGDTAWADRARATARLVRAAYDHASSTGRLSARTVYALCKLTWFTRGKGNVRDPYGGIVATEYWRTTKLPGLVETFGLPEPIGSLDAARDAVASLTEEVDLSLITDATGFVFAYPAYRNIAATWMEKHASAVLSLVAQARVLESDAAGHQLARAIDRLPRVPRPDGKASTSAANILTPAIACLDPRSRFPLLNGSKHVQKMLRTLGVAESGLADQHDHVVALVDPTIPLRRDSFALDQHGIGGGTAPPPSPTRSKPLSPKPTKGRDLPIKDARDIEAIVRGGRRTVRRLHNDMTNALEKLCRGRLVAQEGVAPDCMYDALVADYDGRGRDLLIEVKSSTERGVLRLAVGQLLDYRRGLTRRDTTDLAVLLPAAPDADATAYLSSVGVKALWFTDTDLVAVDGAWSLAPNPA